MEAKSDLILYIANRGEIARRIIKSARRLGFKTVVGYSDQDRELPFVQEADDAVALGGEESKDTYLNIPKVIAAAKKMRASHLHPGYGFLSENSAFVDHVANEKIIFVGPPSSAMRLLGDKIGSRRFLQGLGVPLLPYYDGDDQTEARLQNEAELLGFPILIKPSAGGGGKGMVKVSEPQEFLEALRSSKRVAQSAFSDDRVFLERFIEKGRHIEVQILRDHHGQTFIVGERECSVQRAHQKVIEEAPCAYLPDSVREIIFDSSRNMADASGYISAGTVEWIWDGKSGIYFLEVNARLQVEHPVTEEVWGVDLVEAQLKVALGEKIEWNLSGPRGHAIEARICAENPAEGFMPSGGPVYKLSLPPEARCDFGYMEKNSVPSQFDSMMGKVICHGENRDDALNKLSLSIQNLLIVGPNTNRAYILQLLNDPQIRSGNLWTRMLEEIPPAFCAPEGFRLLRDLVAPAALEQNFDDDRDLFSPWGEMGSDDEQNAYLEVFDFGDKRFFHSRFFDWSSKRVRNNAKMSDVGSSDQSELRSPLPARAIKILATNGMHLNKGDLVMIVEAMKMEIKIKSPRAGRVKEILVVEGDRIPVDALLMTWMEEQTK